ncbi:hypothetical protein DPR02_37150 [Burkholderia cepacia]|uniref:Uncharacterized protein n=1 Tax=Burkholderia cepacia TaxID=292 RepID=A0AAQ0F848_BURCE|nr:hypothetical protein DPR02_37150 [Burkholderia cepacia]
MNPLFWLSVASSARAARSAGGARPASSARDDAAGMPAAAAMVYGTGFNLKRNNEKSLLPKSR